MTITKLRPTFTPDQDRLDALRAIAPEAFADGKINWDALREALGDRVEDEGRDAEHFGLFWPGKRDARRLASTPSAGALKPAPGEGVNEATTRHLFIEGDNLEVLKLLQKSYAGRVKMIYIDPPYNTGNDFVYPDDFSQPLEEYLRMTGQSDEAGRALSTNAQGGGRFHSNWLSMMYPRLRLARHLLREDGGIFVSIDDGEVANLKLLMGEVFGEENFVAHVVWQKRYVSNVTAQFLSDMHDHILFYARQRESITIKRLPRTEDQLSDYQNPDNDPRGPWRSQDLSASKPYQAGLFTIETPAGLIVNPPPGRYWRCHQAQYEAWLADNRISFGKSGQGRPMLKSFLSEAQEGVTPNTWWSYDFAGHNKEATLEVKQLFDGASPFDTPKPARLIRRMIELFVDADGVVMDFFAGSCTTAQSVLEFNREVSGDRRFIMVQLPEPTLEASVAIGFGFTTIAEVGKERIRRVIKRMQAEDAGKLITGRDAARGPWLPRLQARPLQLQGLARLRRRRRRRAANPLRPVRVAVGGGVEAGGRAGRSDADGGLPAGQHDRVAAGVHAQHSHAGVVRPGGPPAFRLPGFGDPRRDDRGVGAG